MRRPTISLATSRIVPNQDSTGYEYLTVALTMAWPLGHGRRYRHPQKLWINLNSNQPGDTDLNGVTVLVKADDETYLDTVWAGETLLLPYLPLKQVVVTVGNKTGYYMRTRRASSARWLVRPRSTSTTRRAWSSSSHLNQGAGDTTIEGATGTINGINVNYGDTLKVAMGQQITVHCNAIENYVTPADYTGTASAQLTPPLVYQTTLVTISWESNLAPIPSSTLCRLPCRAHRQQRTDHQGGYWFRGGVVFPNVEGYRTPSIATFTG